MTSIAIINASTVVKDEDVPAVIAALQVQIDRDFFPAWGFRADLRFADKSKPINPGEWLVAILDNSDQAGIMGFHDITANGAPMGKVFAATDLQYGDAWSSTLSHELLEMLADPDINLMMFDDNTNLGYSYEVCDAVEADGYGYDINGVRVSDFVYPSWFETFRQPNSTKFDHCGHVTQPLQLATGGYISVFDFSKGGWQQNVAADASDVQRLRARPPVGSRRERRTIPRFDWLASKA